MSINKELTATQIMDESHNRMLRENVAHTKKFMLYNFI